MTLTVVPNVFLGDLRWACHLMINLVKPYRRAKSSG